MEWKPKKRMDALSVPILKRALRQKKRQKQKYELNTLKKPQPFIPDNLIVNKQERISRSMNKLTCKVRSSSIPSRNQRINYHCYRERANVVTESQNNLEDTSWIEPFIQTSRKVPCVNLVMDNQKVTFTVDTGATRVLVTSALAEEIWNLDYKKKLKKFPNIEVQDAQGNLVNIIGYKICSIIAAKKKVEYPVLVYEAQHKEALLGYTFLLDNNLNIYTGVGIGTPPQPEVVKRLNYTTEPLNCLVIKDEVIPPKAIKAVKVKINFPEYWSQKEKIAAIGSTVVIHSEDIETQLKITQLSAMYTYDLIGIDHTATVIVDNNQNCQPLYLHRKDIIAHAEFVHEEPTQEEVKRIINEENESFETLTQNGEYKMEDEKQPERYEYVDKINIKSNDKEKIEFGKQLLMETEDFWSKHSFDLGEFDRKARITINQTQPMRDKYRPVNPKKEEKAQKIIDQLEKHQLISRANSPFCSQPVWVWKKPKDKAGKAAVAGEADLEAPRELRLALDYRKVNKMISSHCHFPNPNIKELLFKLKSAKYISIMDLSNSYWQIPLTEATKPIFAFQTSSAQYVWNRLPQGTAPSMAIMAEAVQDTIMSGGLSYCCVCYVDNIIVFSNSYEQHKQDLKKVVDGFIKRGWKANPAKSHLLINDHCRLFGFHVDLKTQTIGPDPQKVSAIVDLPPPTTQKEARSLNGAVNYYSDLIPDLGPLMTPLHEVTKKGDFQWTDECQANFELIKKKLAELPVVYLPDFNQSFHLYTDAAMGQYLGYHISQYKPSLKKYVPISWGSHKFNKNEQTMSQPEAELFAIVYAVMQESLLLCFSKVIVHTDCKSLTYLFHFSRICSKLTRWQIILASYDLVIYFEPSESIGIVLSDILSRRPGKRMVNRRPKLEEITQLPKVDFSDEPQVSFSKAKQKIEKVLETCNLTPEIIKYISERYTPEVITPQDLRCNTDILMKVISEEKQLNPIDDFKKSKPYPPQYVYVPEQLEFQNDISPSGRLINFVLQEAPGMSIAALKHHQMSDPYFGPKITEILKTNKPLESFELKQGILLKKVEDPVTEISFQICVPKSLSLELITKFHNSVFGSHPDLKKLMSNLKKRFYIKSLKNECQHVIKSCKICTLNKSFTNIKQPFGAKLKVTGPRQVYAMDICTVDTQAKEEDLPTSFLIITDCWSLYTIAVPINADAKGRDILELFSRHIIQPFGIPKVGIVTDGAKNFSNRLSNTFSSVLGLQQFRISPYNARANPAERVNRALLAGLRYASQQFKLEPEVFKNLLNYIVLSWNTSVLSHLNFSPYQLFLSTPYEPAALTSFVTIQEADRDYGDFISSLVKTQTLVENLVNKRYQETRDKRYDKKAEHSKHSIYQAGTQVMIKKREDNTERAHKLRPRYVGPYKIVQEYQNNVEVIPWMPNRKIQMIHKYKNEARNIPKFEKYLISNDRIKPCDDITFYYDEMLARRFYQEFWDTIRDVEPIQEVERYIHPMDYEDIKPKNRPSSLILPAKLGIQRKFQRQIQTPHKPGNRRRKSSKDDISSISSGKPTNRKLESVVPNEDGEEAGQILVQHPEPTEEGSDNSETDNEEPREPTPDQAQEFLSDYESAEDMAEDTNNGGFRDVVDEIDNDEHSEMQDNDPPRDHYSVNPEESQIREQIRIPTEPIVIRVEFPQPDWVISDRIQRPLRGRSTRLPLPRTMAGSSRNLIQPPSPGQRLQRPMLMEGSNTGAITKSRPPQPKGQMVTDRPLTMIGFKDSDKAIIFRKPGPSTQHFVPTEARSSVPSLRGTYTQRKPKPAKSVQTSTGRIDPAIQQILTSNSSIFQDPEFDRLKESHSEHRSFTDELQDVSNTLDTDYQNIENTLDNILQEENE